MPTGCISRMHRMTAKNPNIFPVIKFGNETWNLMKLLLGYLTKPEKSIIVSEFVQAREMKNWQNAQRKNAENDRLHRENIWISYCQICLHKKKMRLKEKKSVTETCEYLQRQTSFPLLG